mgnify:CR=1 FL=1
MTTRAHKPRLVKAGAEPSLTSGTLRDLLHYDQDTGVFTWRERPVSMFRDGRRLRAASECSRWNSRYSGSVAGTLKDTGYVEIGILGKLYPAHRLAWLMTYGRFPQKKIDHVNGERADNRIANLREADDFQNAANSRKRKDNTSGFKGVSFRKDLEKWQARIGVGGRRISLGLYDQPEAAHAAYIAAAKKHHANFANYGGPNEAS